MIRKLLLIRKSKMTSTFITDNKLNPSGGILSVCPKAWEEEAGLSHYGLVLELKLKELDKLKAWLPDFCTLVECKEDPETALDSVGLKLHPSADE